MKEVFSSERKLIFLFFLGVLLIFSQTAAAQSKIHKKNYFYKPQIIAPPFEAKTRINFGERKSDFVAAKNSPNPFRAASIKRKFPFEKISDAPLISGESIETDDSTKNDFAYRFSSIEQRRRFLQFKNSAIEKQSDESFARKMRSDKFPAAIDDSNDNAAPEKQGFQWRSAIGQSLLFLAVQHGYAIGAQAKTRRDLKHGAFWRDYIDSVKSLHGWDDGGRFFTNYIAHPMQGAMTGFIYVQNNPSEKKLEFNESSAYWKSRLKAFAWSAAWSTQFEIGPISQASIGNVGLHGKQTWEDIIVTPTAGTLMLIGEDAVDRFITRRIERNTDNFYVKIFARMLLSPVRNFSNLIRFKQPWYRDRATE